MLFPDLFYPFNEIIMQNLEGFPEIKVGGHNVHDLTYTDEPALIPEKKEDVTIIRHCQSRKQKERVWFE